jgi:hypothetical protein
MEEDQEKVVEPVGYKTKKETEISKQLFVF